MTEPYADLARPPLHVAALRRALLVPGGLWTRLEVVEETGSTNADVAAAARDGAAGGLVIVAEQQTAGRGRAGRSWVSAPRAGLAVSVLLRPAPAEARWGWLPLLAGVALADAVARLAELDVALKWPNDLLVTTGSAGDGDASGGGAAGGDASGGDASGGGAAGAGKCAGILAETLPDMRGVVLGIGLNVTTRAAELPPPRPGATAATSLELAGATVTDRDPLLRALLRGLAAWYGRWGAAGGDADACGLREAYLRACGTVGREVRAVLPGGEELTGTATTVDIDGRLVIRTAAGRSRALAAGDVTHLR
jgi:BirA family biotin operon repressor/biotin-[acetyl-CoA-carboxylase] ligase